MYGRFHGAGWLEKIGLQDRVDIVSGSFSKQLGLHGGYIARRHREYVDATKKCVVQALYSTTSIPPVICAGALASVKYPKDDGGRDLRNQDQEKSNGIENIIKRKQY